MHWPFAPTQALHRRQAVQLEVLDLEDLSLNPCHRHLRLQQQAVPIPRVRGSASP